MNSVAAVFVLELDQFACKILMPPTMKNMTENIPPLNFPIGHGTFFPLRAAVVKFYSFVMTGAICILSTIIFQTWCGELQQVQDTSPGRYR